MSSGVLSTYTVHKLTLLLWYCTSSAFRDIIFLFLSRGKKMFWKFLPFNHFRGFIAAFCFCDISRKRSSRSSCRVVKRRQASYY